MNWLDPKTNELTEGFKEKGFLPEAFINLLALLGWNAGTEQELFTKEELVEKFSIDRVHNGSAKFDYEKAKWFNHEWIKKLKVESYLLKVKEFIESKGITITDNGYFEKILELVKDRCTLLPDFYDQSIFFFTDPVTLDTDAVKPKWNEDKKLFFIDWVNALNNIQNWDVAALENSFKELATAKSIKPGELQMPLRVMLVGGKFGPPVFVIAEAIGKAATINRIQRALDIFASA
jgi:glutamyl-tRNA synthetase